MNQEVTITWLIEDQGLDKWFKMIYICFVATKFEKGFF